MHHSLVQNDIFVCPERTKFVAARDVFDLKTCQKSLFGRGSAPDPAGGAYNAPQDPLAGFRGPTSKGSAGNRRWERKGERAEG